MPDLSSLDRKYFIDNVAFNCPFCNRNNIVYSITDTFSFDWKDDKKCFGFLAQCSGCGNISMHLSFDNITALHPHYNNKIIMNAKDDIDSHIFYSVPTSFFVLDERVPRIIRELITEAEGCLKMNFLTGSSASMRKAIYELLVHEEIEGDSYDKRIKTLKQKYSHIDSTYFDVLGHIKDMTSDKVHEQSWDKWDSKYLILIIETLKSVLDEIYVIPHIKNERISKIQQLLEKVGGSKKNNAS